MSNVPSRFLNGAQLEIVIDDPDFGVFTMAYTQALSFSHNMRNAPVGGIGSYSQHTLEPLQYSAQGSMVVTRYSSQARTYLTDAHLPGNMQGKVNDKWAGGNGLLHRRHFNPVKLLISRTFDIIVKNRASDLPAAANNGTVSTIALQASDIDALDTRAVYVIYDCRMTNFSFNLTTAGLLNETVTYVARGVKDLSLGINSENTKDQQGIGNQ